MLKKILILTFGFYFLVLFQISFLVHFIRDQRFFSPVLISIALLTFFEKREVAFGFLAALLGGFFLDMFSDAFIGFYITLFVLLVAFIKFFIKRYVYFLV